MHMKQVPTKLSMKIFQHTLDQMTEKTSQYFISYLERQSAR